MPVSITTAKVSNAPKSSGASLGAPKTDPKVFQHANITGGSKDVGTGPNGKKAPGAKKAAGGTQ